MDSQTVTNGGKIVTGIAVALSGAGASWVTELEVAIRVSASGVALIAGIIAIWFAVADRIEKKKHENKNKNRRNTHHRHHTDRVHGSSDSSDD